ncbi:MAG: hypothetical protein KDK33_11350, partial [Leptospiraceae bacterium]|nr:hypothetical protein [Leptospiraceae bacterium]
SLTSKSEEERKWALLGLIGSPEENALISSRPSLAVEGYPSDWFTIRKQENPEEIRVPVYGGHFIAVGDIYDLDVDTSKIPGAPTEYDTVLLEPGKVAEITYEYDPRLLKEKGLIEEFMVYTYDKSSGQWLPARDVTVDTANHKVTARTNHFTPYVLTALPAPADGGVYDPPQCVANVLGDPSGSASGPKWARFDSGFKYYVDRGYTIRPNNDFYDLHLDEAMGIATCNGGVHTSSPIYCGSETDHKYSQKTDYIDFDLPFDARVFIMYDSRGSERASWLNDLGFNQEVGRYVETTDAVRFYEVYSKDYAAGSHVTLPGNHFDLASPNQINTNYFVAVLPRGNWVSDAGIDCSQEPKKPDSPTGISLIPGSDQISIIIDQSIQRNATGLIVRKRLLEPALSPVEGEAVGVTIQDPGFLKDSGLTEGLTYYYSFFAVTDDGIYSLPLVLSTQTGRDDDADGIANYYENNPSIVYATGNRTSYSKADTDGDGLADLEEILNYTDPTNGDADPPIISSFSDNRTIATIPVARFDITTADASPIVGYYLSDNGNQPLPNSPEWQDSKPTQWDVASLGTLNLSLWVKDAAGNVSARSQLTLEFPYFFYSDRLMKYTIGEKGIVEMNIDPGNGQLKRKSVYINDFPLQAQTYSGVNILSYANDGNLNSWYPTGPTDRTEIVSTSTVLGPSGELFALEYNANGNFFLAGVSYPASTPASELVPGCIANRTCLITFRFNPSSLAFQVISTRNGSTAYLPKQSVELVLSEDGSRFMYYSLHNEYLYGGKITNGFILTLQSMGPVYQGGLNGSPQIAVDPEARFALLPGDTHYAGGSGIRVYSFDGSQWTLIERFLTGSEFSGVSFSGNDRILAINNTGLHSADFDPASGQIVYRTEVLSLPGTFQAKKLFLDRAGSLGVVRSASTAKMFQYDKANDQVFWTTDLDLGPVSSEERIVFNNRSRGNQPPSLSVQLPEGMPVMTVTGWKYPFQGIFVPDHRCLTANSRPYPSNRQARWALARLNYSDPDANKCGVASDPSSVSANLLSQPSPTALYFPIQLFENLHLLSNQDWERLGYLKAFLGEDARFVCPGAFASDGSKQTVFPITPKQPGDYRINLEATDAAGSCEGSDQTARVTLNVLARNRRAETNKEFINTDEHPESADPLWKFNLDERTHAPLNKPQLYLKYNCQIDTVVCMQVGSLIGCLPNQVMSTDLITRSEDAVCGPPIIFKKTWLHDRYGDAKEMLGEMVLRYVLFGQTPGPEDLYEFGKEAFGPTPQKAKRGLLFLQAEQVIPQKNLYRGQWIGFEEP